jgi:hypothetical protein
MRDSKQLEVAATDDGLGRASIRQNYATAIIERDARLEMNRPFPFARKSVIIAYHAI